MRTSRAFSHPQARALAGRAVALLIALGAVLLVASPAQAAAYRFWGYFQWDGTTWAFAQTGPAETVPADGDVEGWRFAVGDEAATKFPRAAGDFDLICGSTPAVDGMKRVAVVVDFGTAADAAEGAGEPPDPRGQCAVVDTQASGTEVLAGVAEQRVENGLVCGINGWPETGCGEEVAGPVPTDAPATVTLAVPVHAATDDAAAAEEEDAGSNTIWLIAAGAGGALMVGVWAWARLRRHDEDQQAS